MSLANTLDTFDASDDEATRVDKNNTRNTMELDGCLHIEQQALTSPKRKKPCLSSAADFFSLLCCLTNVRGASEVVNAADERIVSKLLHRCNTTVIYP